MFGTLLQEATFCGLRMH